MNNLMPRILEQNTSDFENLPFVLPNGFREYDARWIFQKEINLCGLQALGLGLGTLIQSRGIRPKIVIAHDFRSYSQAVKQALMLGLVDAGCEIFDIGLAVTPMAYFAQFELDLPCVAMVTASHNENGWTGIKMGMDRPLTFGAEDMASLKDIVLQAKGTRRPGGIVHRIFGVQEKYQQQLIQSFQLQRKLKVAVVCGNGTAGAIAPAVMRGIGCDVVEVDCTLDHRFPHYNPNPEDLKMLKAMSDAVLAHECDLAFGFDGDGDRVGVVDNLGHEIFADKLGVLLARDMATQHANAQFVVDVKSTGLFKSDPVLRKHNARVDYWKTGHSYIKQRTQQLDAIAGFEKSGHFFLRGPYGAGYDDGLASAIQICRLLDRTPSKTMHELYHELPTSFTTPTMSPKCSDAEKYQVVEGITHLITQIKASGAIIAGQKIKEINVVNGIRFEFEDGSFGLIRASSNKPELVVVCESFQSNEHMREIFSHIETLLAGFPAVGEFNQKV
ncbi:MAG: phosphomannomutase/phosphoglucomutase [Alphaproteobacteria bacterium]|nr:phosphomannomutase/phosphoglucomutase [Alphaproteobacteria bacterium]